MKNLKRFMAYILWVVLVGCIIVWANLYKIVLKNEMNPMILIFIMLLPIFIGLLLALPRFVSVILKTGVWTFDWVKFIAVGLPSFLASGAMPLFWTILFFTNTCLFYSTIQYFRPLEALYSDMYCSLPSKRYPQAVTVSEAYTTQEVIFVG